MTWQDLVIALGSICFSLALLPLIRQNSKPPLSTASLTTFWLFAYVIVFATLGLWFSAITAFVNGSLWAIIGWSARGQSVSDHPGDTSGTILPIYYRNFVVRDGGRDPIEKVHSIT